MPAVPQLTPSRSASADHNRRGFLVAGSGSIGRRHLSNLARLGETKLTLYRSGWRHDGAPVVDAPEEFDFDRALAQRPRAVLVCNPSALHLRTALAAARADTHLFVEKPLSHSLVGIPELRAETERRGLVALVGFQYRFHPSLRRIKEWVENGAVGRIVSARVQWGEEISTWHPGEDWRRSYAVRADLGGGAVRTLCHPFDYLRWFLGEVEWVQAALSNQALGLEVEDLAHVTLGFASGCLASVSLDYLQWPRTHGLEIVGTRGRVSWTEEEGSARFHDLESSQVRRFCPSGAFSRNSMFVDEMRHFLACLDGDEHPQCTLDDGQRALEIVLAALRSHELGRRVKIEELN